MHVFTPHHDFMHLAVCAFLNKVLVALCWLSFLLSQSCLSQPPPPCQTHFKPYTTHTLHPIPPYPSPHSLTTTPSTPSTPPQPHSITPHTLLLFPAAEACPPPQEIFTPPVIAGIVGSLVVFTVLIIGVTVTIMFACHKRWHKCHGNTHVKRQPLKVIGLQELHQPNVAYMCRYVQWNLSKPVTCVAYSDLKGINILTRGCIVEVQYSEILGRGGWLL